MRLGDSPMDYVVVANANPMPPVRGTAGGDDSWAWGEDGFDFGDILDAINPLQHLPVISTLYRELTGDEIAPMPRIMGGTLFGGVYGAIASLVNVIVEDGTGKDIGAHALALLFDRDGEAAPGAPADDPTAIAEHVESGNAAQPAGPPAPAEAPGAPSTAEIGALEDWAETAPPAEPEDVAAGAPAAETAAAPGGPAPGAEPAADATALVPGPWIADRMMRALEQYGEMLQKRQAEAAYLDLHS